MKKIIFITGVALFTWGTHSIASELDELGDIKLVDESAKSSLFQKGPIVGCSDHKKKKELTCSKKPEAAILSKLPTSQQLDDSNLEDEKEANNMKNQLLSVITELAALKKAQKVDQDTIKELKSLVQILEKKTTKNTLKQTNLVKKSIKKISKEHVPRQYKTTRIKKPIKEIEIYNDHVVIEVQNNESLSTYAQVYYNDNTQYYRIYKANKNKINKSLQIVIGDKLIIPQASSYKE